VGHDYRVDVSVVVWEGQDVLRVPSTALFRTGDRWAAFRVADSRARKVPVELGATDGTSTVVAAGLLEADQIITQPSDLIDDGTWIGRR
jgi:HlyD family secretion protein